MRNADNVNCFGDGAKPKVETFPSVMFSLWEWKCYETNSFCMAGSVIADYVRDA